MKHKQRTFTQDGKRFRVTDARLPASFHVTRADQRKGVPDDPVRCMLAVAMHRQTGCVGQVAVLSTVALVEVDMGATPPEGFDGDMVRYGLTPATQRRIREFDHEGTEVPPQGVILTMKVPSPHNRAGTPHEATGQAGPRDTVPDGARKPRVLTRVRGGFSSYRAAGER